MMRSRLALVCLAIGLCSFARAEDIPIVGVNDDGDEVVRYVSREKFVEGMATMLGSVQEEAIPALSSGDNGGKWKVRTVALGIGLDVSLGFSPIFALGIAPRFGLAFSNSKTPIIP